MPAAPSPEFKAISARHHKKLATQLAAGANPQQHDPATGMTLLMAACESDHLPAVRTLLAHGANPNEPTNEGRYPLHVAMRRNDVVLLDLLLDAGARPEVWIRTRGGMTPLFQGVIMGAMDALQRLAERAGDRLDVNAGQHEGPSPLIGAVNNDKPEVAQWLVDRGADVELPLGNSGATALVQACSRGLPEMLRVLVGADANPNAVNQQGLTPLHMLARHDQAEVIPMVQMLLAAGADPLLRNARGQTPAQAFESVAIHRESPLCVWWRAQEEKALLNGVVSIASPTDLPSRSRARL